MGLFDGVAARGVSGTGASADIAEMLGWPVLLVLDPSGQAQTAAAIAAGLRDFRAGVRLAGVVLNRVASPRHEDLVRARAGRRRHRRARRAAAACRRSRCRSGISAWCRPRSRREIGKLIDEAARFVAEHVDLDAVLRLAACELVAATCGERH